MAVEVRKQGDRVTVVDADLPDIDGGDRETTYTLQTLTPTMARDIRKKYVTLKYNGRTHRSDEQPMTDEQAMAYGLDLIDAVLVAWSGVLYEGQPLACSREHKALLDEPRKLALLKVAGLNRAGAEAARAESFRSADPVLLGTEG